VEAAPSTTAQTATRRDDARSFLTPTRREIPNCEEVEPFTHLFPVPSPRLTPQLLPILSLKK
jgi:hypothetical protein